MLFSLFVCISAYGLLTFAVVREYRTTLPYCIDNNEKGQCIPCPENAKCVETEVQCDERYAFQNGQCVSMIVLENDEESDSVPTNYLKESQTPKQIFLFTIEIIATIIFIFFVFIQLHQNRSQSATKDDKITTKSN